VLGFYSARDQGAGSEGFHALKNHCLTRRDRR
jgi:hypothetical protein